MGADPFTVADSERKDVSSEPAGSHAKAAGSGGGGEGEGKREGRIPGGAGWEGKGGEGPLGQQGGAGWEGGSHGAVLTPSLTDMEDALLSALSSPASTCGSSRDSDKDQRESGLEGQPGAAPPDREGRRGYSV